jgi:hypothetical protein
MSTFSNCIVLFLENMTEFSFNEEKYFIKLLREDSSEKHTYLCNEIALFLKS